MTGLNGYYEDNNGFTRFIQYDHSTLGSRLHGLRGLFNGGFSKEQMRFYLIEGGSVLAIAGGFLSYFHGDSMVGSGGLLLGIAGIITAATPIIQGWLTASREERRRHLEKLDIPNQMRENEAAIAILREEVKDLHESVKFKRDLIEQQQRVINILVTRVGTIELATAKVEEKVSEMQSKKGTE